MQPSLFFLASLVGAASSLAMKPPSFIELGRPSDNVKEMLAIISGHIPQIENIEASICPNLPNVTMDQGSLPPPSQGLSLWHVAVGHGTQNYSCPTDDPSAVPFQIGAQATLYNLTCMTGVLPQMAARYPAYLAQQPVPAPGQSLYTNPRDTPFLLTPTGTPLSGHHYFTNNNKTATFNLHTALTDYGITFSNKIANISAPTGSPSGFDGSAAVPWLKLSVVNPATQTPPLSIDVADSASAVQEIYRINTAGGAPPKTCSAHVGQALFTQTYSAEYWFWRSS